MLDVFEFEKRRDSLTCSLFTLARTDLLYNIHVKLGHSMDNGFIFKKVNPALISSKRAGLAVLVSW